MCVKEVKMIISLMWGYYNPDQAWRYVSMNSIIRLPKPIGKEIIPMAVDRGPNLLTL